MDSMDNLWRTILWKQFGAAIDMLDNALVACPDSLWRQPVWHDPSVPSQRTEFWYVAYHALFWLDLYLFGSEEGFAPPAPYTLVEQDDAAGPIPIQPFSRDERARLPRVYAPEMPHHHRDDDGRASAPTRQLRLDEGRRGRQLRRATTV